MQQNLPTHYSAFSRFLHWSMALLILVGLVGVETNEFFPKGSGLRTALLAAHFQAGLIVLALVWWRIGALAFRLPPPIFPEPPQWQHLLARSIHLAFYAVMIASPILGIIVLQASGKSVDILGLTLPTFVMEDKSFSKALKEIHETIGNVMIGLIIAHIAAAIWHHSLIKDNTLRRMLPPND